MLDPGRLPDAQAPLICSALVLAALSEAGVVKSNVSPWISPNRVARIFLEQLSANKREVLFSTENEAEWAEHRSRPGQVVLYQRTERRSCGVPAWSNQAGPAEVAHARQGPWQAVGSVAGERYGREELRLLYEDVFRQLGRLDRIARRGGVLCADKKKHFNGDAQGVPQAVDELHRLYLASVSFVADCQAMQRQVHAEQVLQAYMCADDHIEESWPKFAAGCLPDFAAARPLLNALEHVNLPLARLQAIRWKHD